ncbi:alpha/beta hydrolase [Actinomyces faecalis]|uniref:alpha/beta hydrolase n=1 Tax=Actinomyces faecalis TaxID=2722820 RepID=UPI0015522711|nr:alpha/beta hydrolase [Actinomyces faecalis]
MTACGGGASSSAPEAVAATGSPAPVPAGLAQFYDQDLQWYPCDEGDDVEETEDGSFSCAVASVPLDYAAPDGQAIQVALKKRPATKEAVGTLFVNPGGPGGSGLTLVDSVDGHFSDDLIAAYDVVGFDPRGVGASTAVDCLTDAELDEDRAGQGQTPAAELSAEEAQRQVVSYTADYAAACEKRTRTPGLLDHIDTVSAARDLDVLRALVGDEVLTYLGYSYGTYLGATYAELFPSHVGRMVLDGAIDPTLNAGEMTLGQAKGFENALRAFVEDCQAGNGCPLNGGVDNGVKQVRDFLQRAATAPVPTSDPDRPLTYSLAEDAMIGVLYQDESWSVLAEALNQAMLQNDGSTMLYIADLFASRNADGTYSGNGDEVIGAINCLDYPVVGDPASWQEEAAQLAEASPTFGADLAYSDLYCQTWGRSSARERTPIHASGAAPVLVVGTTGDPATPYEWSQALVSQLDSAALVTWEGNGHTAYGRAGSCVTTAVDAYLLAGVMPEDELVCRGRE